MTTSRATEDGRWLPAEPSFLAGGKFYMTDPLGATWQTSATVPATSRRWHWPVAWTVSDMTATEHKVWQFMRTISHPATGFRVYDIYEHATDPRRYAHVYNGPMVGRPRACIYLVDAGIGQMTDETTVETFMEGVTR